MGAFIISPLPSLVGSVALQQGPFAQRALPRVLATTGPSSTLSPSVDFLGDQLYDLPSSVDFSTGRGGLLQLLDAFLSSCRRFHPAGASVRASQHAAARAAFALTVAGSASGAITFGATCAFTFVTAR
jgi:hypothetical protein